VTARGAARGAARASALVALGACCFGSISVLTVVGTRDGTSLSTLLAWRYLPGALLLLLVAPPSRARLPLGQAARLLVLGGAGQAAVSFVSLSALRWIPAGALGFLFYTYPTWVAVLAVVRRTEHVDRRRVAALALSFGGIALMVGSPWAAPLPWQGVALALAAAFGYALYVPYLHRIESETTPAVASTYVTAGAGLAFLGAAIADGTFGVAFAPATWAAVAGLALLCTFVAFLAFLRGLATLGPVRTAIVSTVEPFWTSVLGVALLGQPLSATTLVGGALIGTAVLLLQLPTRERAAA